MALLLFEQFKLFRVKLDTLMLAPRWKIIEITFDKLFDKFSVRYYNFWRIFDARFIFLVLFNIVLASSLWTEASPRNSSSEVILVSTLRLLLMIHLNRKCRTMLLEGGIYNCLVATSLRALHNDYLSVSWYWTSSIRWAPSHLGFLRD